MEKFWTCKFSWNSNFNEKKYKIVNEKNTNIFETIYKNGKRILKFGNSETEKKRFHQHEKPIAIKSVDINKILASNKARSVLVKKNLDISLDKNAKKLDLYVHFSQKWVHIEETLMKLNKYLFW